MTVSLLQWKGNRRRNLAMIALAQRTAEQTWLDKLEFRCIESCFCELDSQDFAAHSWVYELPRIIILKGNLSLRSILSEVTMPYIILISDNIFTMMKINGKLLLVSFPSFIPSTRYSSIKHMCAGTNYSGNFFISNVWWTILGLWWDSIYSVDPRTQGTRIGVLDSSFNYFTIGLL